MSTYTARSHHGPSISGESFSDGIRGVLARLTLSRGTVFGVIILMGMLGFEVFNYSTTQFALGDLLGEPRFAGLRWATILALAFCAIDFAGIARLLTPERDRSDAAGVWYLLGAWFLAATMNAMLTWWGVSLALLSHDGLGNEILGRETLLNAVPVFVAMLVWLIRVLMIGTLCLAGPQLFTEGPRPTPARLRRAPVNSRSLAGTIEAPGMPAMSRPPRPAPKSNGNRVVPLGVEPRSTQPPSQ